MCRCKDLARLLPTRQGPLKKRKDRDGIFNDWNHRFFVLQGKTSQCYDEIHIFQNLASGVLRTAHAITFFPTPCFSSSAGAHLLYYNCSGRSGRGSNYKGMIPLSRVNGVVVLQGGDVEGEFRIDVDDRNLRLKARSKEEAISWAQAVLEARDRVTGGQMKIRQDAMARPMLLT